MLGFFCFFVLKILPYIVIWPLAVGHYPFIGIPIWHNGTKVLGIACSVPKDLQMQLKLQAEIVDFHHVFVVMASSTLEITASKMVTDTANFWFHPCHFSKHFVVGCAHRINFIPGTE